MDKIDQYVNDLLEALYVDPHNKNYQITVNAVYLAGELMDKGYCRISDENKKRLGW
jgi:hypothetical protein